MGADPVEQPAESPSSVRPRLTLFYVIQSFDFSFWIGLSNFLPFLFLDANEFLPEILRHRKYIAMLVKTRTNPVIVYGRQEESLLNPGPIKIIAPVMNKIAKIVFTIISILLLFCNNTHNYL